MGGDEREGSDGDGEEEPKPVAKQVQEDIDRRGLRRWRMNDLNLFGKMGNYFWMELIKLKVRKTQEL